MRFQQIDLSNWRVYYGKVSVRFTPTGGGNLWVVDGNNGYGKTSLLKAIQWCLYEKNENRPTLVSYLNRKALSEGVGELSVRLLFENRGKQYNLLRRAFLPDPANPDPTTLRIEADLYEDGRPVIDLQARIDQMLPEDASQFFFFDGLEISRYAQVAHSAATREAIERVLGIPAVRNARTDVGQAIARWERDLDEELKRDRATQQIYEEMEIAQSLMKRAEERKGHLHKEIENAEQILQKVEEELARAEEVKHLFGEKEFARQKQLHLREQLDALHEDEERFLRHLPLLIIERELRKVHTKWQLSANGMQDVKIHEAVLAARVQELERILYAGQCLCGRELNSPPDFERIRERLMELRNQLSHFHETAAANGEKGNHIPLYFERLEDLLSGMRHVIRDPAPLMEKRSKLEDDLTEVNQLLETLEEKIGGLDDGERQGLIARRSEIHTDLKHMRNDLDDLAEHIKDHEKEVSRLRRQLEQVGEVTPRRQALEGNIKLAKAVLAAFEGYITDLVTAQRSRIESETTKIHRLVTNKPDTYDRVVLRDDYSLDLIDKAGNSIPTDGISAGEREALAFSFIAGLNLASDANAPVVMDTPFGHLDTEHRTNILKALPQLPTQVILLATDRDIPPSELPTYAPFLAGQFVINYVDGAQASRIDPTV